MQPRKSKEKEKTTSTPLVTVSDLQRMKMWETIVLRIRMMPFKTKMTPNWKMVEENGWGKNYPIATFPVREKGEVKVLSYNMLIDRAESDKLDFSVAALNDNKEYKSNIIEDKISSWLYVYSH